MNRRVLYLISSFVLITVILVVFIFMEESKTYILHQQVLPHGSATFTVESAEVTHKLYVKPDPESGWGYPEASVNISIVGPNGAEIVSITNYIFSTYGGVLEYTGQGYSEMTRTFTPESTGEHVISVNSDTDHIEGFFVKIEVLGSQ